MKRWIKVFWICIAVTFAAGLAISVIAFAAGARNPSSFYVNQNGLRTAEDSATPVERSEHDLEELRDITIALGSADVRFAEADSYGYEVRSTSNDRIDVSLRDGRLRIHENNGWSLGFIKIDFLSFSMFGEGWDHHEITVFLPKESKLNTLKIQSINGDTELAVEGLAVADFSYDTVSGNLVAEASGMEVTELTLKAISGDVDFAGTVTSRVGIDMVSGRTKLKLDGSAEDYQLNLNKVSGTIFIDGRDINDDDDWPISSWRRGDDSASRRIDINLVSGGVEIDFKE
jgi:hypothetical protein